MEINELIKKETDPIYKKISKFIPEIEWAFHAPLIHKINMLKKEKNAVVLAHNYQTPEIFYGIADIAADSLALAVEAEIKDNKVEVIRKKSSEAFEIFDNNFFDMIYIDGNHLYDFVLSDILNSLDKIKNDGIIVCDDYKNDSGWFKDGVTKAVNVLKKKGKIKVIHAHNFFNNHYQCIFKKI